MTTGSRAQVFHGTADKTSGGLSKNDLMLHKGRIVSKKAHAAGLKAFSRLAKAGYKPKKGEFKLFTRKAKGGAKKTKSASKRRSTRKSA